MVNLNPSRAEPQADTIDHSAGSGQEVWISTAEAAELLGISERAVRYAFARGRLQGRISPAPGGGRRLEIAVASMPEGARAKWGEGQPTIDHRPSTVNDHRPWTIGDEPSSIVNGPSSPRHPETGLTPAEMWANATEAERQVAVHRRGILDKWERFCEAAAADTGRRRGQLRTDFIGHWRAAHPDGPGLSPSTLYRWQEAFRLYGLPGLLPGYHQGARGRQIPEPMRARFYELYMTTRQLSVTVCRGVVWGELLASNDPRADQVPSVATFRRYAKSLPKGEVTLAREGSEAWRRKCEPFFRRDYSQVDVMQIWVSDHAQFDFFCRDLTGRAVRPWVTLWMDMRSRVRVGWCIHTAPSQDTILAALAEGILRYGIPAEAYTDNGRDYSALTLAKESRRWKVALDEPRVKALSEHLKMKWHFALPEAPQGKGMIERAFGVDRERFDKFFVSYCGRDTTKKPEELEAMLKTPRLLPTIREVAEKYGQYVSTVANVSPHAGQGMEGLSPLEVFASQDYVKRTATLEELVLLFMRTSKKVKVGRNGIWAFDRDYWLEALGPYLGQDVYYRYRLSDVSSIHVFTLAEQLICTARRDELRGRTSADYREVQRRKKEARQVARADIERRDEVAATGGDPWKALAATAQAQSGPPPGLPKPKVLRPLRSPFEGAAKQLRAEDEDRPRRHGIAQEASAKVRQLHALPQPEADPDEAELLAEASAKLRLLHQRIANND